MTSAIRLFARLYSAAFISCVAAACAPNNELCTGPYCQGEAGRTAGGSSTAPDCAKLDQAQLAASGGAISTRCNGWHTLSESQPSGWIDAVGFDPRVPNMVFASAGTTLYRSDDSGRSWAPIARLTTQVYSLAFPARANGTVLAGSEEGIIESNDYGLHWQSKSLDGLPVAKLAVHPADDRVLLAAVNQEGLLRSLDGGTTWIAANNGILVGDYRDVVGDPNDPSHWWVSLELADQQANLLAAIFESTDSGQTWHAAIPAARGGVRGIASCASNPRRMLAGGGDSLLITRDSGKTWTRLDSPNVWAETVAIGGTDCETLYVPSLDGPNATRLLRSVDGGATFAGSLTRGMEMLHAPFVNQFAFDPADPSHLLVKTVGGLFETRDAGDDWRLVPNVGAPHVTRLLPRPNSREILAVTFGSGMWRWNAVTNEWSAVVGGDGYSDYLYAVAASPRDTDRLLVGGWGHVSLSEDGGRDFSLISTADTFNDFAFSPSEAKEATAGTYLSGAQKTLDGGRTWSNVADSLAPIPDGLANAGARYVLSVAYTEDGQIVLGTSARGIFVSHDNGGSWSAGPAELVGSSILCLLPTADGLYVGTDALGVARVRGASLDFVNQGIDSLAVTGLVVDRDGTVYATTTSGIYRKDTGDIWENLGADQLAEVGASTPVIYRDATSARLVVSSSTGIYAHDLAL